MSLHTDRANIAQAIYQTVDLPEGVVVMEVSGWEHTEGGLEVHSAEWVRPLFLENPENPDGDSVTAKFVVTFYANSVEVKEASLNGEALKVPIPY
jgi:histidinol-phosphate/aromatic aminotransferase/cobyric acid decarboxylase-like protein